MAHSGFQACSFSHCFASASKACLGTKSQPSLGRITASQALGPIRFQDAGGAASVMISLFGGEGCNTTQKKPENMCTCSKLEIFPFIPVPQACSLLQGGTLPCAGPHKACRMLNCSSASIQAETTIFSLVVAEGKSF